MVLNSKFVDLERTAIQCRGKQSELDVFQQCDSYEDYRNCSEIKFQTVTSGMQIWWVTVQNDDSELRTATSIKTVI